MQGSTATEDIAFFIKATISKEAHLDISEIDNSLNFHQLGFDSISAVFLLEKIEEKYQLSLSPLYFWDYPTIGAFASKVFEEINT